MWPILAIAAASAIAQNYQAEKARGAAKERLDQLQAEFDRIKPPNYDVSVTDPPSYIQQSLTPAHYDATQLTPEQFKIAAKYQPQLAEKVAEKDPTLVKMSAAANEGRNAQLEVLRKMRGIASSDMDPELGQKLSQASRQAQIDAQSRGQSIQSQMERRGAGNSGISAMLQQQASADAMDREANLGQQAAAEGYRNKLAAMRGAASLGGDIANSENSMASQNTDIINQFNQRFARDQQAWANNRADTLNAGQRFNVQNAQDVANRNTNQNNEFMVRNRSRDEDMQRERYQNDVRERDYQNAINEKRQNWIQGQKEYRNSLSGKQFDDKYRLAAGRQGLAYKGMDMDYQTAADRNAMIQGVGQAGMGYMSQRGDDQRWSDQQDRADARERYRRTGKWDDEDDQASYGSGTSWNRMS